ncbi:MoaA/NifB/PqqE/SkfB family radical SAM enzyme, partial [Paenibacillus forsythiae]|nr:MoaA/NifB/PqqE/SkfB family radical SAM enzyme [Paenibacillus forsythiae]
MKPQPTSCSSSAAEDDISRHPCYSEEAHRFFARMHIPVAPACNIQCNYC